MVTRNCTTCGEEFTVEPLMVNGREMFPQTKCEPCGEARVAKIEQEEREAVSAKQFAAWESLCPPLYRDTDPKKLPAAFFAMASSWRYDARGVGFVGGAGLGKTRAAFLLLRGAHFSGKRCAAVSSTKLAILCADQFSSNDAKKAAACEAMEQARSAKVLLIDDIGKSKMTERCEMELFDILEHRTSYMLPTIWTANATGAELLAMMSPDRGEPILRRLSEFSEIIRIEA